MKIEFNAQDVEAARLALSWAELEGAARAGQRWEEMRVESGQLKERITEGAGEYDMTDEDLALIVFGTRPAWHHGYWDREMRGKMLRLCNKCDRARAEHTDDEGLRETLLARIGTPRWGSR
jgi:hypothetical protein